MRKRKRAKNALLLRREQRGSCGNSLQMLPIEVGSVEWLPTFHCQVQCISDVESTVSSKVQCKLISSNWRSMKP